MRRAALALLVLAATLSPAVSAGGDAAATRILVFTRTELERHASIDEGVAALRQLAAREGWEVVHTEDPSVFTDASLAGFAIVVFLSADGDVMDPPHEAAFERYIRGGGGFVGIHAAATAEYENDFYGEVLGARYVSLPPIQPAVLRPGGRPHPSTDPLPRRWTRTDEWYHLDRNPRPDVHVLLTVSERTYEGGQMGSDHPLAWCHRVDRGRSWYTALGHLESAYSEPLYRKHLLGGLRWAAGVEPGPCDPSEDEDVVAALRVEGAVEGSVFASPHRRCSRGRRIEVVRPRRGADRVVGRDRADRDGHWRVDGIDGEGPFRAVAPATDRCRKLRSGPVG